MILSSECCYMKVVRLTQDYIFPAFDCGNQDLNDFLSNDSKSYMQKRLAVTYLIEDDQRLAGYFSVLNDKLTVNDIPSSEWRRIKRLFPHRKHRRDYPAVKIGRLAIDLKYQGKHIGSDILNFIKYMFSGNNRTGCAFVTVDALKEALPFYLKNCFHCIEISEDNESTVQLYFDLNQLDSICL